MPGILFLCFSPVFFLQDVGNPPGDLKFQRVSVSVNTERLNDGFIYKGVFIYPYIYSLCPSIYILMGKMKWVKMLTGRA